ncbi:unnamed protein product [Caenorhabditis angaria]|uniref:Uncharacterized protein n=1 Tax=Caenorhabditis angaria TaxID=860376 RepID=A0A9P1N1R8_9PELO|nr:unnamed protein product [Caenorhabditis angaria]
MNICSLELLPPYSDGFTVDEKITEIVETIQFVFVCFTFPFYCMIVYFLFESQAKHIDELRSPFYKLCISTAVVDLWTLSTNYLGAMFPKWGWGVPIYIGLGSFYTHVYLYFAWSTGVCQAMSVSVLAANRLTALTFPDSYEKIWNGKRMQIAYGLQFILGLLIGLATFTNPAVLYRTEKLGVVPAFTNGELTTVFFIIGGLFLFANCIYLICSYCYLFYRLRLRNNQQNIGIRIMMNQRKREKARKSEYRLFIMSNIVVGVQISVCFLFFLEATQLVTLPSDTFYLFYNAAR